MHVCRALEGRVCPLIRHPNLMSLKGGSEGVHRGSDDGWKRVGGASFEAKS